MMTSATPPRRTVLAALREVLVQFPHITLAGRAIDLIDLATAPEPPQGKIVQTGRCIVGSDNNYARLIQRHLIEQADFMPYRSRLPAERRMAWIGQ